MFQLPVSVYYQGAHDCKEHSRKPSIYNQPKGRVGRLYLDAVPRANKNGNSWSFPVMRATFHGVMSRRLFFGKDTIFLCVGGWHG